MCWENNPLGNIYDRGRNFFNILIYRDAFAYI